MLQHKVRLLFIIHGNADPIVSYQQSAVLYEKLTNHGVKAEFMTVIDGAHGKFPTEDTAKVL